MLYTKEEWLGLVESGLPPVDRYSERNRAITSRYARWYLDHQNVFKWAGMASFASRQVGVAIVVAEMLQAPQRSGNANLLAALHRFGAERLLLHDFEEIRKGNNNIFRDIAWAHAAFIHGGFPEVEANAEGSDRGLMLDGFDAIARGMARLTDDPGDPEGLRLVWEGNIALLRHEQLHILQPVFDLLSPGGRVLASFGSELDFSCTFPADRRCIASFPSHYGYVETLAGWKSIADADHRWQWVAANVIPAWMEADRGVASCRPRMEHVLAMSAGDPGFLHHVSAFTGRLLRVP